MKNLLKFLLAASFFLAAEAGFAQAKPKTQARPVQLGAIAQTSTMPQALSLNHIAIYVNNLKTATDFYENILQLKVIPEPFHDGRHTWFTIGGPMTLHLIQGADANIKRDKDDHLCFSVKSVEAFMDHLNKNKVEYTNWPGTEKAPTIRVDGVKQIYFQDPDGHWIEINDENLQKKNL
ncbi:VOC family protein [Adhaeribacter aquaticus]|uniref:VOC family protein n=1 Tax=Adhaeribacter aquaticus TaxID=299567 RepID=UPI0004020558|nr:VOC family protein [Adhaeribacter aquaticus]